MNQIAQQLKERNIAEYLIYMWQEEDLIRANHCEPEEMEVNVISRYPEEQRSGMREWYGNLITMMNEEGVREAGHLQMNGTMRWLLPLNFLFTVPPISKHCRLSWNCGIKTARRMSPNWKPALKPCTEYSCSGFRENLSVKEQPRQWKPSLASSPCWRTIMIKTAKVN